MAAFVQGTGGFAGTTSGGQLAYTSSVTKGNLLVVFGEVKSTSGSNVTTSILTADSIGTSYFAIPALTLFGNGAGDYFQAWWGIAPTTGANTVFINSTSSALSGYGLNITEFSGVNAIDQSVMSGTVYSGSSPEAMASPSITPGAASGIAIAFSLGSAVNPSSFVGTNGFTDNYGFWQNNAFIDQNWLAFSSAAAISTTITATFTGTLTGGRIALATFINSSARERTLMGVGQ
jgi:hypothetical protein